MNEDRILLKHIEDLIIKAQGKGAAFSKFLTPAERTRVEAAFSKRQDISLIFAGGFSGAERQVAVLVQPDWGSWQESEHIIPIKLLFRAQDQVGHKHVLGTILGLGISREMLGDIQICEDCAYLVCLSQVAPMIFEQVTKVGRVGVKAERITLAELPDIAPNLTEEQLSVASLRLDAFIAAAFHRPRSEASAAILAGMVQLRHQECLDITRTVEVGDIISWRGKGRVKLLEMRDISRKGKLRIQVGYFG